MARKARKPKYDWWAFLTPQEAKELEKLDEFIGECRLDASEASRSRHAIVNRAIHRAKYHASRTRKLNEREV